MLTPNEVQKLADLALLEISDTEAEKLAGEMDAILGYVSELSNLTATDEQTAVPELRNVLREDEGAREPGLFTERLLAAAPRAENGYLKVKKIL